MHTRVDLKSIRSIDAVLHEPSRLSIVVALSGKDALSFGELKNLLGMTDGNLSIHLRRLEHSSYIVTQRELVTGKTRTLCRLSAQGRDALGRYAEVLKPVLMNLG